VESLRFYWTLLLDISIPISTSIIRILYGLQKKPSDFYSLPSRCRFTAVFFFTNLARTWLLLLSGYCERYSQRRDNAISTHQKILTIYSLQDDKTHSNYVNTCNKKKNLIVQSYRSTSHVIVRSMFLAMLRCYPPIFA